MDLDKSSLDFDVWYDDDENDENYDPDEDIPFALSSDNDSDGEISPEKDISDGYEGDVSDLDQEELAEVIETLPDVESPSDDVSPYRTRTAKLRKRLESSGRVANAVLDVLQCMNKNKIDLPLLLDYLSYSNFAELSRNATVNYHRTTLLSSHELTSILDRWYARPTKHGKGMRSWTPAQATIHSFIISQTKKIFVKEVSAIKQYMKLDTRNVSKDVLLSIVYDDICEKVKMNAPTVYACFKAAAWSPVQEHRSTLKSPEKVCK
jgi:hypothetical protein